VPRKLTVLSQHGGEPLGLNPDLQHAGTNQHVRKEGKFATDLGPIQPTLSQGSASMKKGKSFYGADHYDTHVGYAVDILFKSRSLVQYMETLEETPDSLMTSFIESMIQLKRIVEERLNMSASEEIKRENDLKTAYRSSMMLSDNIQELEEQLEKQRQELGKEHDRKEAILQDLAEKIGKLREKSKKRDQSDRLRLGDFNDEGLQQEHREARGAGSRCDGVDAAIRKFARRAPPQGEVSEGEKAQGGDAAGQLDHQVRHGHRGEAGGVRRVGEDVSQGERCDLLVKGRV
jgi:hypothetical protein